MSETAPDPDVPWSPAERRLLDRALGCAIEEFIARFGAETAVKRVQTELRRARRARSRKLYGFWSAVLARIETKMELRQEAPPHNAIGWKASSEKRGTAAGTFRSPRRASTQKPPIAAASVLSTRNRVLLGTRPDSPRR